MRGTRGNDAASPHHISNDGFDDLPVLQQLQHSGTVHSSIHPTVNSEGSQERKKDNGRTRAKHSSPLRCPVVYIVIYPYADGLYRIKICCKGIQEAKVRMPKSKPKTGFQWRNPLFKEKKDDDDGGEDESLDHLYYSGAGPLFDDMIVGDSALVFLLRQTIVNMVRRIQHVTEDEMV